MDDFIRDTYDQHYSYCDQRDLDQKPNPEIVLATHHAKKGKALDIGCGMGINSLFLARLGFKVKAVDLSPIGIEKLKVKAAQQKLEIEAVAENIIYELLSNDFTLITCNYVLQTLSPENARWIIQRMQQKVLPKGVNVLTVYGQGKMSKKKLPFPHYFFQSGEIRSLYEGWKIIHYKEVQESYSFGENKVITLVAQKT